MEQADRSLVEQISALLGAAPFSPPDVKQLERETGAARPALSEVLRVMERHHTIVRVSPGLYFLSESIDRLKNDVTEYLAPGSDLTPGMFRDRFGTSRKYTIPLLEYLDREGVTVRVGEARRAR